MNKLIFILLLAMTIMSCNHEQIEIDSQKESVTRAVTVDQVIENALTKLETKGVHLKKAEHSNLRSHNDCLPTLEGNCITYTVNSESENEEALVNTLVVPGANGRPSCNAVSISYDFIICTENFVITSITITNFETSIEFNTCPDLFYYWASLSSSARQESISSFEFQAQLILEKLIMDVLVNATSTCESGGYIQAVAIKNTCYSMCWRGAPFWDYSKTNCGYLCCTRKTNYCRDTDGKLNQGDPYLVIEGDGDCENQIFCWGEHDGNWPQAAECFQNDCLYEVIPDDTSSDH